jgi:hypothetical protein
MKNPKRKPLDWANILASEARLTDVILVKEIAAKYKLPVASAGKALSRLADRRLVSRVANGVYVNKLVRDNSALDFVSVLKPNSYVSLESALSHWGLSTLKSGDCNLRNFGQAKGIYSVRVCDCVPDNFQAAILGIR